MSKYGPTSDKTGNFRPPFLAWVYNQAGNRVFYNGVQQAQALTDCRGTLEGGQSIFNAPNLNGTVPSLPSRLSPQCAVSVSANPTFDIQNTQLSGTLTVTAFDEMALLQHQQQQSGQADQRTARGD